MDGRPIASDDRPWPLGPLGLRPRTGRSLARPGAAVLGLARSGLAAARLLLDRGCRADLLDLRVVEGALEAMRELESRGARLRLGPHDPAWLAEYDFIVKSPGVPATIPFLQTARELGVAVISEIELAFLAAEGPVFAITGTNGKSTTTAWAGDMIRRAGLAVEVAGNIGRAFSEAVLADPRARFVCEVSSFQLEDVRAFRPRAAVLLNLTPDHLDRHGTMEQYREIKMRLFDRQEAGDLAIVGPDDDLARAARGHGKARRARFATRDLGEEGAYCVDESLVLRRGGVVAGLLPRARLALPGPHNVENALAAAAGAAELGAPIEAIAQSLASFPGLPHRLEPVGTVRGVRFVNDSKATNTDSLSVALDAFSSPVILIAGGRHKDQDFRPLAPKVARSVQRLVLIGEAADRLAAAWPAVPAVRAGSLEEAVRRALELASPGQVALLSPACASFDMFSSYEDRGDQFRELVRRLQKEEE